MTPPLIFVAVSCPLGVVAILGPLDGLLGPHKVQIASHPSQAVSLNILNCIVDVIFDPSDDILALLRSYSSLLRLFHPDT
jgi:hypothetical protein